jgi:hypothetical protein
MEKCFCGGMTSFVTSGEFLKTVVRLEKMYSSYFIYKDPKT